MKTDEALQQGIIALGDWLKFLDTKKRELNAQLERIRKSGDRSDDIEADLPTIFVEKEQAPVEINSDEHDDDDEWL
mgnify:CR=1 FL=1